MRKKERIEGEYYSLNPNQDEKIVETNLKKINVQAFFNQSWKAK